MTTIAENGSQQGGLQRFLRLILTTTALLAAGVEASVGGWPEALPTSHSSPNMVWRDHQWPAALNTEPI